MILADVVIKGLAGLTLSLSDTMTIVDTAKATYLIRTVMAVSKMAVSRMAVSKMDISKMDILRMLYTKIHEEVL